MQLAVASVTLNHREANASVMKFISDLIRCTGNDPVSVKFFLLLFKSNCVAVYILSLLAMSKVIIRTWILFFLVDGPVLPIFLLDLHSL